MPARLSVNVNKFALLRNARGSNLPDLEQIVRDCVHFGAEGITVHPRPDGRHIRRDDVYTLAPQLDVEFNIEGYPSAAFLQMMAEVRPAQCTLVPDPPDALTSSEGWDTIACREQLREVLAELKAQGIRTSLFMENVPALIEAAREVGADRIELYTGPYAAQYEQDREAAIRPYIESARLARQLGLGLNAGHDLNLDNLTFLVARIPEIEEVSIGHALICDALYMGLEQTIRAYLNCIREGQAQAHQAGQPNA